MFEAPLAPYAGNAWGVAPGVAVANPGYGYIPWGGNAWNAGYVAPQAWGYPAAAIWPADGQGFAAVAPQAEQPAAAGVAGLAPQHADAAPIGAPMAGMLPVGRLGNQAAPLAAAAEAAAALRAQAPLAAAAPVADEGAPAPVAAPAIEPVVVPAAAAAAPAAVAAGAAIAAAPAPAAAAPQAAAAQARAAAAPAATILPLRRPAKRPRPARPAHAARPAKPSRPARIHRPAKPARAARIAGAGRRPKNEIWAGVRDPRSVHITQVTSRFNRNPAADNKDCGPASVAMSLLLLGMKLPGIPKQSTAQRMINRARALGGSNDSTVPTTNHDLEQALAASGASTETVTEMSAVFAAVKSGKPVILNGNPRHPGAYGPSFSARDLEPFDGAHWIVVSGFDKKSGKYIINDPLSRAGALKVTASQLTAYCGGSLGLVVSRAAAGAGTSDVHRPAAPAAAVAAGTVDPAAETVAGVFNATGIDPAFSPAVAAAGYGGF